MKTIQVFFIASLLGCTLLQAQQPAKVVPLKSGQSTRQADRVKSALTDARIDPARYEHSGQVTATVYLDGRNYESEDYSLLSVVGSQLRGISRGMWFEPSKQWIHNHLTYSNYADGDTIRFRLHDMASGNWYEFEEFVVFKPDMLIGDALNPFILKTSSLLVPSALSPEPSLSVWPNPAGYSATICYTITADQPVVIQVTDSSGRVVDELDCGNQKTGEHLKPWNPETLKQGIYLLRLKNAPSVYQQVVITR